MAKNLISVGLTAAALSFAFVSCTPSDSEKEKLLKPSITQPLNSKQSDEFSHLLKGIGRVFSASLEAKGITEGISVSDPTSKELKDAIVKAGCLITFQKDPNTTGAQLSLLTVAGDKCPVSVNVNSSYTGGDKRLFALTATFSITDPTLKSKNDIFELALLGQGFVKRSEAPKEEFREIQISGTVLSATKGTIRIQSSHTLRSRELNSQVFLEGQRNITLSFPKINGQEAFTTELAARLAVVDNEKQSVFTLNGLEISEQEFAGYLNYFGLVFE